MTTTAKNNIRDIVLAGTSAALFAVISQLSLPLPSGVPVTLQTFAAALCGYILGTKRGMNAVSSYIFLGVFGVPVFSGFKCGFSAIVGPTGGFILGFLLIAALCGVGSRSKSRHGAVLWGVIGIISAHLLGVIWFSAVVDVNLLAGMLAASLPYIGKDILFIVAAADLGVAVRNHM